MPVIEPRSSVPARSNNRGSSAKTDGGKGAGEEAAGGKENTEELNDVLAFAGVNPENEVDTQDDMNESYVPRHAHASGECGS